MSEYRYSESLKIDLPFLIILAISNALGQFTTSNATFNYYCGDRNIKTAIVPSNNQYFITVESECDTTEF